MKKKKEEQKSRIKINEYEEQPVIRQMCGQTLGLGLVDRNRTVVIISLQQRKNT